ncbi:anti-sigma factor domain-containing protein, partial [Rhodoplanes elegans]
RRPAIPPADVTPGPTELPVPAAPEVPIAEPVAPATPAPSPPPPFAPIPAELIAPEVLGSAAPSAPPLEPAHEPAFEPTPEPAASPPDVLRAVAEALAMPLAETDGRVTPSVAAGMPAAETAPPRPTPNDAGGRNAAAADTSAAVLPAASSRDDKPAPVAAAGDDVARAGVAPDKVAREIDVPAVELRAVDADGSFGAGKAPDIKILPDDDAVVPGYPRGPAGGPDLGPASGPLEGSTGGALVPLPAAGDDATVRRLVRSVQRWRSVAVGLLAFVLALAGLAATAVLAPDWLPPELRLVPGRVEVREVVRTVEVPVAPPPAPAAPATDPARHVAVLQAEGTTPAFIVSLQPDRKSLMVRRVKAADEGDKRYELWLVSDKYPAPRSLGLLGTAEFTIVPAVADFPPDVVADAVYAVSLEAEAGSPIDGPSTPVLASGRLIEAVPEMPASSPSGNGTP